MQLPAVIDIEASGFGAGSYPIEAGWVEADGKAHCYLIKPFEHWIHWDEQAQSLHGITRALLNSKGKAPKEVCLKLNASLQGRVVYSDAWSHDMCWLGRLFEEAEVRQAFRMESILTLLNEEEKNHWSAMLDQVRKVETMTRHRASADARVIQKCFRAIKTQDPRHNQLTG